jgi:xanthine dehydrogenase small subunit
MSANAVGTTPRTELTFRFRGRTRRLSHVSPRTTLLDWLRESEGATGAKEGCAEGDCGACTLALVRRKGEGLAYLPVNACILLLGQVDGSEIVTIEDLAQGETLHPVQQAMVDLHGSQCGFCTPGIVMSLFAHYHDGVAATRDSVNVVLAGNLCRCTGYRPIVDAALSVIDGSPTDRFKAAEAERRAALAELDDGRDLFVGDATRFFAAPASEASLAELYQAHPDAVLLGGATDVGLWVTKRLMDLNKIIWLGRVAGFDAITDGASSLRLGAGVTLDDATPRLEALHADLGDLMRRFGSRQVRASGTVGGNIANGSPIGDLAPALIALGANVELRAGKRVRELPLEDFFIAYGKQDRKPSEYVSALVAPKLAANEAYRAFKVTKRFDEDISAVMFGLKVELDGRKVKSARLAYGGMAATPKRAAAAEAALVDADLDDPSTWAPARTAIAQDFKPLTDMRATAAYRLEVAGNLILRALTEISGAGAPTRLGELRAAE